MDFLEEVEQHRKNGCNWGSPSGADDNDECCDCEEE